jgi:hypothetical protein
MPERARRKFSRVVRAVKVTAAILPPSPVTRGKENEETLIQSISHPAEKKVLKMLAEWNRKKKKVKRSSAFWLLLLQRALRSSVQISAN